MKSVLFPVITSFEFCQVSSNVFEMGYIWGYIPFALATHYKICYIIFTKRENQRNGLP